MDWKQKILSVLSDTQAQSAAEISLQIGLSRRETSKWLKQLTDSGEAKIAPGRWAFLRGVNLEIENPEYGEHARSAKCLEAKGLWRRAKTEWLAAFDTARDPTLRSSAVKQISRCEQMAKRPYSQEEGGISGQVMDLEFSLFSGSDPERFG